jgi:hypothetical protein
MAGEDTESALLRKAGVSPRSARRASAGDPRECCEVAWALLDHGPDASALELARRFASKAIHGKNAELADEAAILFLCSDGAGGWEDPVADGKDPLWAIRQLRRLARSGNARACSDSQQDEGTAKPER